METDTALPEDVPLALLHSEIPTLNAYMLTTKWLLTAFPRVDASDIRALAGELPSNSLLPDSLASDL